MEGLNALELDMLEIRHHEQTLEMFKAKLKTYLFKNILPDFLN